MTLAESKQEYAGVRSPASRGQVAGMAVGGTLGAALGVVGLAIAIANSATDSKVWTLFAICEGLALVTGGVAAVLQLDRNAFLTRALRAAIAFEDGEKTSEKNDRASDLRMFRNALVASHDFDIAGRLQRALRRF